MRWIKILVSIGIKVPVYFLVVRIDEIKNSLNTFTVLELVRTKIDYNEPVYWVIDHSEGNV